MGKKRLLWQLYPSYLLITFLSVLVVAWYASRSQEAFYFEQLTSDLEARGEFARSRFKPLLADGNEEPIRNLCVELGRETSTRITIILPGGRVVADSEENPAKMDNHADRPEVIE
ncbi:PAS domain-containing sensor histidine kinase, partial [Candidatus Sumerlaeota bacterium]|nr:PAS domain-containing sensor histidine kinase [Candidatus Sumerlaeota bacterium]